jgi:hypothetical protein
MSSLVQTLNKKVETYDPANDLAEGEEKQIAESE